MKLAASFFATLLLLLGGCLVHDEVAALIEEPLPTDGGTDADAASRDSGPVITVSDGGDYEPPKDPPK